MKFNFTSQICTTEEQSKRLLALGLNAETADMSYQVKFFDPFPQHLVDCTPSLLTHPPINDERFIPAWSLHRLIEMCPLIPNPARFLAVASFKSVYVRMNDEVDMCYAGKGTYNNLIDCIEWLIREGYFNKEYLVK